MKLKSKKFISKMKLILENFRCYEKKIFEFPDEGLTLLSGPSGIGKSTIMNAIFFALFDTGKSFKPQSFGKESCKVEFDFQNLHIERQRRPNRLVLLNKDTNKSYVDEEAETIIKQKFGFEGDKPHEFFLSTCYLKQNGEKSFFLMKSPDKLEFLEKLAFHGIDLPAIKAKCKHFIKTRNETLISTSSQLELISAQLKEMVKPEKMFFPIKTQNKENAMSILLKNQENKKKLLLQEELFLEKIRKEILDLKILNVKITNIENRLAILLEKINSLQKDLNLIDYQGDEYLQTTEEKLTILVSQRRLTVLKEQYENDKKRLEDAQTDEIESIKKHIQDIVNILWKEYDSKELISSLSENQQLLKELEKLEALKQAFSKSIVDKEKLEENKNILEKSRESLSKCKELLNKLKMQQNLYICPSCDASLRFENDKLLLFSKNTEKFNSNIENTTNEISNLTKIIKRLEYVIPEEELKLQKNQDISKSIKKIEESYTGELPTKKEIESNIEYLQEYKRTNNELEKKKHEEENKLHNKIFSATLNSLKDQLSRQKDKIKDLEKNIKNKKILENEEELRNILEKERINKSKKENFLENIKNLNNEKNILQNDLDILKKTYLQKYSEIRDIDIVEEEIKNKESCILEIKKGQEKRFEQISKLQKYEKYLEDMKRYTDVEKKHKELEELEIEFRKKYTASTTLFEKIKLAESLAICNVVDSINAHAKEYLDLFFPNDSITVDLLTTKQTKTGTEKPGINVQIQYKDMEANEEMLSGGELSRVVLAFTLALTEIFNTPLLLLDECTASLDQETTSLVMEGIKTHFTKPIILIAHQVVTGEYDSRIEL